MSNKPSKPSETTTKNTHKTVDDETFKKIKEKFLKDNIEQLKRLADK